ncbi:uncharacterized protein PHACADRAFT_104936 [Phanerochaete carnosa HHB-10118-sp]|uniref:Carrier domain-containing protein n=1 Tax=Phanerochaete carnosa (strain HHB-10118-sp) TaxID=650164 RepID=K5VW06_PHACS|nr:uncharacterized protein PHACADRAFT_104936 [Phanerochaete carnosa HHB-10118-sp]EKM50764.1 hypothetical protein PHACADRAFT_104936 [Phanerochaete carnosa HHB-10118-sp]
MPIGRPLKTCQTLVIDRYGRLVPPGVIGELVVGGEGVAKGYLNRPAETAGAFVELHFDGLSGNTRFYRTGDAVRWCDGQLQFTGRMNAGQIKIRGQRLELGEIEAAILRTELVTAAGVSYHKPTDGNNPSLIAYIVFKDEQKPEDQVRDHDTAAAASNDASEIVELEDDVLERLRAALPSYMVPDLVFSVLHLPLQTSGKLDRRQLAAMAEKDASRGVRRAAGNAQDVAPADEMEAQLCKIFGDLLSLQAVSPLASFFNIGGHSLLATRLKSSLESQFLVAIPLRTIFAHSSPRGLAASIRELVASGSAHKLSMRIAAPSDGTYYPLSFAQDRLWFLSQLAYFGSQDICYNSPYTLKLEGRLNVNALERTIQEIVSRHEVLRTIFVEVDHVPATHVVDFCPRLEIVSLAADTDEQTIKALMRDDARRPFSLDTEPSLRATLFKLSEESFYLLVCMHHIVVDGFSLDVLHHELSEIYAAFEAGKDHPLAPLGIQYKEFAQWQRSEDFEHLLKPQAEYWTKQLRGSQPAELPMDFPRPQHLSHEGKTYYAHFSAELLTGLEQICKKERVTMFMLLSAVFRVVQFQLTSQTDASFAFPIANRNRPETERLIGFFVNTQILRLKARPSMTFLELLQQARNLSLAAFEYQDMPFERIVSIHNPNRELTRNPLAHIVLAYQTVKTAPFTVGDIHASVARVDMKLTRFDMEIHFFPKDDTLHAEFVYSTDLFKEETIVDLTDRINEVLYQNLLLRPDLVVEEIPFQHSAKHLERFGVPLAPPPPPPSSSLVDALKKSVNAHPDLLALQDREVLLSYRQLNTASSLLAQKIVQASRDACEFVAVCVPPSALAVISILAIVKSGAAYVPLDVRYPPERLEMLLRESGARLLITTSDSPEFANNAEGVTRLDVSDFLTDIDLTSPVDFDCAPRSDAAYVMYTSGSTGVPKGVVVMQSSVIALVSDTNVYPFQAGDKIAMINNLAWDASIIDIWCTLLTGATVVCFNRYDVLDLVALAEQFQLWSITGCFMSVALFRQALDLAPQLFSSLRLFQVGGEAFYYEDLQRVKSVNPSIRLFSAYGTTETCVFATGFWIDVPNMPISGPVPIGRPMSTVQVLVVDTNGRLVPPGVIGELIIGGAGVGPGYLKRPKETAEAFVEFGFDELNQGVTRYYRTVRHCFHALLTLA